MQDDDRPAAALARLRWQGTTKAYRRDHARMMAAKSAEVRRARAAAWVGHCGRCGGEGAAGAAGLCQACHELPEPD